MGNTRERVRIGIYIIFELYALGNSKDQTYQMLKAWDDRNIHPLGKSFNRVFNKYLDFTYQEGREVGCNRLEFYGYCIGKDKCDYWKEFTKLNNPGLQERVVNESFYNKYGWPDFLEKNYQGNGLYAHWYYQILREEERLKGIPSGGIIYASNRYMAERIWERYLGKHGRPNPYGTWYGMKLLCKHKLIKKFPGYRGRKLHKANGYIRISPIPAP
jgi:hypothetical protein